MYHPDRLTTPLKRTAPKGARNPGWRAISWDEALAQIAERMAGIRREHGAEQVAFSVTTPSGSHLQDCIPWIERFIRAYGSPDTIYATEICNWHEDHATRFTFGHDIGTPDFAHTDCVLLWDNNPAVTWLARVAEIQGAVKRGARMVVVDPRPAAFAKLATQWLQVLPGTDQALALGLAHLLIEAGTFNREFMRQRTNAPLLVRADTGRLLRQSDLEAGGSDAVFYGLDDGGRLAPYGASRSDTDIVLALAGRLDMGGQFFGLSADAGHDAVPAPAGLSVAQLRRAPGGVELAGEVPLMAYAREVDGAPKGFATPSRRVEIYSETLLDYGIAPLPMLEEAGLPQAPAGYPLRLGAAKIVAFCHRQHRNLDSLRRLMPDPLVEVAPETALTRDIGDGEWVRIRTAVGSVVARAKFSRDLAPGTVCGQHGWWVEGPAGSPYGIDAPLAANLNQAIDTSLADPVSGSIPLRASWCELERIEWPGQH